MMHKPFRPFWSILACCLLVLFFSSTATMAAPRTLRMGIEQNPPLAGVSADGKPEGLFVDLMNEIARLEGWQIEYLPCPQAACLEMLSSNQIDLMAPLAWLHERASQYVFSSEDVITNWGVIYSRPDAHIHSFLELQQRRIGIVPNNVQTIYLRNHLHEFGINVRFVTYATFEDVFKALDKGEVDAAVVGRLFAMQRASAYRVEATPIIFNPIRVHFAFARQTDPQVVATVDRHLALFKAKPDSFYFHSLNRWLHPKASFSIPLWLKLLLISLVGSSLLLAGFNLLLRRSVERKAAELRNAEATFRSIFDNAPIGIFQATADGRLTSINNAFATLFGYSSPEEMLGTVQYVTTQLYADPDQQLRLTQQLQSTAMVVLDDQEFLRSDGTHFFGTMYIRAVREGSDSKTLLIDGFVVDSTERRRSQEIMLQHEKMLMIGGLAAGMAHEINNPLGIIAQDLQNLQRRLSPNLATNRACAERLGLDLKILQAYLAEREISGYLHSISEAVRRTSRIIDNMLQFSRQSATSHQLAPLPEVIDHALELAGGDYELRKLHRFQELRIERSYDPDLPLVPMNVTEIEQVLINLVKNATQALSDWPGERAIRISTKCDGNYALLTLCDTGPGMSEETRLRVFEPFFTTKPVGSGTGLGLAVSHAIITKNHKGLINITSASGKGCCFMIRLPLTQEHTHA